MIKVYYNEDGICISDFKAESYVTSIIESYNILIKNNLPHDIVINISNEVVLNYFVLKVYQDILPIEEIEFYFNEEKLELHKYCGIENPQNPSNIFVNTDIVDKIIRLGYDKMRKDKGWPKI